MNQNDRNPMPRLDRLTLVIAGLWFLAFAAFAARPSALTQLFSMVLTLGLLALGFLSLALILTRWRQERWRCIVPVGVCALVVVLAPMVHGLIRQFTFQRALPQYQAIIRQMESGEIPVTAELRRIPQTAGTGAYAVLAQRTNEVLRVEFLTGGGFPVKHFGYLYSSSGTIEKGSPMDSRWPERREVRPSWFQISD